MRRLGHRRLAAITRRGPSDALCLLPTLPLTAVLSPMLCFGAQEATEVGPGKVIAGIMKRIDKGFPIENILA